MNPAHKYSLQYNVYDPPNRQQYNNNTILSFIRRLLKRKCLFFDRSIIRHGNHLPSSQIRDSQSKHSSRLNFGTCVTYCHLQLIHKHRLVPPDLLVLPKTYMVLPIQILIHLLTSRDLCRHTSTDTFWGLYCFSIRPTALECLNFMSVFNVWGFKMPRSGMWPTIFTGPGNSVGLASWSVSDHSTSSCLLTCYWC